MALSPSLLPEKNYSFAMRDWDEDLHWRLSLHFYLRLTKKLFHTSQKLLAFMLCFKPLHFNHLEKTIKRYHIILKANSSILKIRLTSELRIILSGKDTDPLISTVERDCLERHLFLTESPSWKQSQNYNHETRTHADLASNIVKYKLAHTFHGISKRLHRRAVFKWLSKNQNQSNNADQSQQGQIARWTNHNS